MHTCRFVATTCQEIEHPIFQLIRKADLCLYSSWLVKGHFLNCTVLGTRRMCLVDDDNMQWYGTDPTGRVNDGGFHCCHSTNLGLYVVDNSQLIPYSKPMFHILQSFILCRYTVGPR